MMRAYYRIVVLWLASRVVDHVIQDLDDRLGPEVASPLDNRLQDLVTGLVAVRRFLIGRAP